MKSFTFKPWPDYVADLKQRGEWPYDDPVRRDQVAREWQRNAEIFFEEDERDLIADLSSVGIRIKSVWDIVNSKKHYQEALPVLFLHLEKKHHQRVLEGIARAMAVPESKPYWESLRDRYSRETNNGVRNALALALANSAGSEHKRQLLALMREKDNGASRAFFLDRLARWDDDAAWAEIRALQGDVDIGQGACELIAKKDRRKRTK